MIKKRICGSKLNKKEQKLVGFSGILVRSNHSEEFTICLCSDSEVNIPLLHMKDNPFANATDHFKFCVALQNAKIVPDGSISRKASVSKMVAEHCSGAALLVGSDLEIDIRHCDDTSSASSVLLAVSRGKVSFTRRLIWKKPRGFKLEPGMSVVQWVKSLPHWSIPAYQHNSIDLRESFNGKSGNSVVEKQEFEGKSQSSIQSSREKCVPTSHSSNNETCSLVDQTSLSSAQDSPLRRIPPSRLLNSTDDSDSDYKDEASSTSVSTLFEELPQYALGWPLRLLAGSPTLDATPESQIMQASVSQRLMTLPNLPPPITEQSRRNLTSNIPRKLPNTVEHLLGTKSSTCTWFSFEELNKATSHFCPENLIGKGGCSNVYKGVLPNGKQIAVKMLKPYKEAWNDFCLEVSIMCTLNHKHITPLIGVCIEDSYIISAYEFFHRGTLEESLHGDKPALTWNARFNVAIKVADSLNYVHNECVIHRDVKSSNILLSSKFQPQLSDFGLAIWGPTDSTYLTDNDVAGTLGYIAPEYFMHGRASDKIDVYSYGVVLLELLSGRRPIVSKAPNGQQSLVKWAKPLLATSNLKQIVDPKLEGNFDIVRMQRMVEAASLCINQSAPHRPKMNQILKLLRGEEDVIALKNDIERRCNEDDEDGLCAILDCEPHLSVASSDSSNADGKTSPRLIKRRRPTLKDHFKEPH